MQHHNISKAELAFRGRQKIFAPIRRGIRINTKRTGVSKVTYGVRRAILGA